jgi:hypothetical protein
MTYEELPDQVKAEVLADPGNKSMRDVMRALGLNCNSSSASTKLFGFAEQRDIDLSRFTAGRKPDLLRKRFGKLRVLRLVKCDLPGQRAWLCQCDCGSKPRSFTTAVLLGGREHCGCEQYRCGALHFNWTGVGDLSGRYWAQVKSNAEKRGIVFELTAIEAWQLFKTQQSLCALSGIPIALGSTASLDRIRSLEGYTVKNAQWVHKDVNRLKWNLDESVFMEWVVKIANWYERRRTAKAESPGHQ